MKIRIPFQQLLGSTVIAILLAAGCGQKSSSNKQAKNVGAGKEAKTSAEEKPKPAPVKPKTEDSKSDPKKPAAGKSAFKLAEGQDSNFADMAKHLDAGGTFYLHLSTEQFLQWADKGFDAADKILGDKSVDLGEEERATAKLVLTGVKKAFLDSGVRELDGVGASSIKLEGGISRQSFMAHHDPAKGEGLIWQLFGTKPHEPEILKMTPADTVMAMSFDFDLAKGIDWLKDFVTMNTTPEVAGQMAGFLAMANQQVQLEQLIASTGGQWGMVITLDEKKVIEFEPESGLMLKIPEPAMALVAKVKGTAIKAKLLEQLAGMGIEVEEKDADGVKLSTIIVPFPPDVPGEISAIINPTLFQSGGYLVLTSSAVLARNMIAVQKGESAGLRATAEFKKLSGGMDLNGNQLSFVSERYGKEYKALMNKALDPQGETPPAMKYLMEKYIELFAWGLDGQLAVLKALPNGHLTVIQTADSGAVEADVKKTSFASVAKHLDAGGSFYLYWSPDEVMTWIDGAFAQAQTFLDKDDLDLGELGLDDFGIGEPEIAQAMGISKMVLGALKNAFLESGLRDINGVGASTVVIEGGLKRNVAMVHHDPAKSDGLIWQLLGTKPHEQDMLKLAPAETAYAVHSEVDVAKGLDWLKGFVTKNTPPEIAGQMASFLAEANQQIRLEELIASLGGQYGVLMTLDENKQVPIPMAGLMGGPQGAPPGIPPVINIPSPGLAIVIKVKDQTLKDELIPMLGSALEEQGIVIEKQDADGVKLSVIDLPIPPDVPEALRSLLSPTIFQNDNYLVFSTTTTLARQIIAVQQGKAEGLRGTTEFKKLSKGMDTRGNHFAFLSERVGRHYGNFLQTMIKAAPEEEVPAFAKEWMVKLSTLGMSSQLAVMQAMPEGHRYVTHTTGMGQEVALVLGLGVAPAGIMASMLLPALAKAKDKANATKSVHYARQLGVGVVGHAFDNDGKVPEKWCDAILQDIDRAEFFVSPQSLEAKAAAEAGQKASSYALNAALVGKSLEDVPPNTVLIFECNLGWNGTGGLKDLQDNFDLPHSIAVVMADGSARQVAPFELDQLRWKP